MSLVFLCSAGCTVGPRYTKPETPVPPAYKETADWKPAEPGDDLARGKWWERFADPELNRLEEKLNVSNQNIAASAANVQASRAVIRQARAQYFPALTVNPGISNEHLSTGFGKALGITFTAYSLPFEASWEPDLWGRIRNTVKANTFAAQVSQADLENTRLSAQTDLAADFYQLRAQDALQQILEMTALADRQSLQLTRNLYSAGLANDESVAQAEAQWKNAEAQAANAAIVRAQYEHAIALLEGEPASSFSLPVRPLNANPPAVPVGVPSQLLERRPDVAAAERAMAQANAQIGIAKAAYYPTLTLSAAPGFESLTAAGLLTWPSRVWSAGPALAQTIFDAGLRRAAVQQYRATYDQTVANYRQSILTAFQQVEDNLAALRVLREVIEEQDDAVRSTERSLHEAEVRYRAGLDPYLNVITAQTALLSARQAELNFHEQQMVATVQLIKALGGGWERNRLEKH